jgi:hypothetical protein
MTPAEEESGLEVVSLQVVENGIENGGGSKSKSCFPRENRRSSAKRTDNARKTGEQIAK